MKNDITAILARIVSAYLIVTGLGFLLSPDFFASMIVHKGSDPVLINLSGMAHFFIGITILVLHFKWRGALEVLVTLIGISFLLKGASLIAIPELTLQTGGNDLQLSIFVPMGFLAVGLVMAYLAWVKRSKDR